MRRRSPLGKLFPLLLVALLPWYGCALRGDAATESVDSMSRLPATGTVPVQRVSALQRDLSDAEGRVQQLEQQLAARDREIAAVRGQIDAARGAPGAAGAAASPATPETASPATASPRSAGADAEGPPQPSKEAVSQPSKPESPAPAPPTAPSVQPSAAQPAAATTGTAQAAGSQPGGAAADQRLAQAQNRIAKLEQQLATELKRRREVEAEMNRLLQETSAGPFERAENVVEEHLREQLDRAKREIADLRSTLRSERRERDEFERRYAALQAQMQAQADAPPVPASAASHEELEALKERQRRVLASIRQDLESSQQRERELRESLEQSQGADGVGLADAVTTLRSENSALQLRLDDEHRRNRDLSAKLHLATRVTDLIFKMQTAGAQPMPVAPLPVAAP